MIANGTPDAIQSIVESIHNPLVTFPNLIDTSFDLVDPETTHIGRGNIIIGPGSLSCEVGLGDFNVLNGTVEGMRSLLEAEDVLDGKANLTS